MTLTTHTRALATVLTISFALAACGPKDADIKANVDQAISGVQGVTVDVAKGVATISGQFADSATRTSTEAAVKAVKGVKSVVDNSTVTPPPPPVVISPDDSLKTNVMAALKDYPTLSADVKDGVVTLTGEIKRADLQKAMQAVNALHPKKVENKATVKK
jgi:hyperosmotically inducible periplasmic protein